ncbi:VOC family protein [Streptomyces buecherae]|uniref:VOC family protein n=1 Tax=Streptomyces buecherae TaxID=2763006 RepID=A0A7H8ND38_9ACTN|nr:VOC family protein [Streptomyces buecherae]QKW52344.1 VOC family protein [Streptomyces buecherae]
MRMAFINLPVSDVKRSVEFFGQLGFEFNAEFSDEKTSCMIVEQNIFVMLLEEDRFKDFINGDIADAKRTTEVITCLSAESREEVDDTVARAIAAGGKPWKPALQEGPMYGGSFQDLDGHVWELMYAAQA